MGGGGRGRRDRDGRARGGDGENLREGGEGGREGGEREKGGREDDVCYIFLGHGSMWRESFQRCLFTSPSSSW